MNNRKSFLIWLEKNKKLSKFECKAKMWSFDALNRSENIYEINNVNDLDGINSSDDLTLYREYLTFINSLQDDVSQVAESVSKNVSNGELQENLDEKVTDVILPDVQSIEITDEVKEVLDGDYQLKKDVKLMLKKESFSMLSKIYNDAYSAAGFESRGIDISSTKNEPSVLVFDIVSGQYYDLANNKLSKMKSYVKYDSNGIAKTFQRTDKAFYYSYDVSEQESSAVAFAKNKPSIDVIQRSILDTISSISNISANHRMVCLVPDNLGDFKDNIKSQIKSAGNIIQIPRSVAAAYAFIEHNKIDSDATFTCYDYGSSELCKTQIRIHFDQEQNEYEFTRMRRQRFSQKEKLCFDSLALKYLEKYFEKRKIKINDTTKRALINTRDIISILMGKSAITIATEKGYSYIEYDKEIIENLSNEIQTEVLGDTNEDDYTCVMFDIISSIKSYYTFEKLCSGFEQIFDRIQQNKPIWNEYLPELSLEVIHDGRFDKLQLIKKGMIQTISESSMDEEIIIPIEDGLFIFEPGKDKIFCPLIREEFGNFQRDKMAMFFDENLFPLSEALQVELSLTYRYGDPDSYRLHATAVNLDGYQIESQWCDERDQIMDNNMYPEYVPQSITTKSVDLEFVISKFYNNLDKDWFYHQDGVHGEPPFDKYGNWYVVTPLIYNIVSIQNMFAPQNISIVPATLISKMESVIEQLLGLLEDAKNNELNFGDCDFDNKHLQYVKDSILNVLSMLGGLCCDSDNEIYYRMVNAVIETNSFSHSRYLLQMSTYILRNEDVYGIWNAIDEYVPQDKNNMGAVRSIGAVCWRNPDWIYSFGECDTKLIQSVIDRAMIHCKSELDKIGVDYNPRGIRDDLETLLGMIRLKETNPFVVELLNCNSKNIKEFVVFLKDLNDVMNEKATQLQYPFVSRLAMEVPEELNKISSVVYPLIELLTGGNAIKLTGFTED